MFGLTATGGKTEIMHVSAAEEGGRGKNWCFCGQAGNACHQTRTISCTFWVGHHRLLVTIPWGSPGECSGLGVVFNKAQSFTTNRLSDLTNYRKARMLTAEIVYDGIVSVGVTLRGAPCSSGPHYYQKHPRRAHAFVCSSSAASAGKKT